MNIGSHDLGGHVLIIAGTGAHHEGDQIAPLIWRVSDPSRCGALSAGSDGTRGYGG